MIGSMPWFAACTMASIINLPAHACAAGSNAEISVRLIPINAALRLASHTRRNASGVFRNDFQYSRTLFLMRVIQEVDGCLDGIELCEFNISSRFYWQRPTYTKFLKHHI